MTEKREIYYRHGSMDSVDVDIVYVFDTVPTNSEANKFIQSKSDEDVNIITFMENRVATSYRGLVDETNNALLATTRYHLQNFEVPVTKQVTRIVPLKVCNTILSICVILRKFKQYREDIIAIMASFDYNQRREYLKSVSFQDLGLSLDEIKYIAFRLGQTLCLIDGKQVYTKGELIQVFSELDPLINRVETMDACRILDKFLGLLLSATENVKVLRKGSLHIFWSAGEIKNYFQCQSRGMVIDIETEKLVYYPWSYPTEKMIKCDWPIDGTWPVANVKKLFFMFNDGSNTYQYSSEGDLFEKVKPRKLEQGYFSLFKTKEDLYFKRSRYTLEIL
jgi:hypothetical protein